MGTTTRAGLRYPSENDETDGSGQMETLAEDTDAQLYRAQPIANAAARPASPQRGWMVHQDDDDRFYGYDGSVWVPLSGSGGGGGGGGYSGGRFVATSAQNIPNTTSGPGTILGLPSAGANMPGAATGVTRTSSGSGHEFELAEAGLWTATANVRLASAAAAGEVSLSVWADLAGGTSYDFSVAIDGGRREGLPRTLNAHGETYLPAGTTLVVYVYNGTGGTRATEPNSGNWCHLDLWRKG
jgi:hypothetical protein